jgi:glycosyltransferase involved in cell wall biosynthesis
MKISVLMPAFNAEKYIDSTLSTIVMQNHNDWEVIIVDGGSTDKTLEMLNRYVERYPNIHVFPDKCETAYQAILKALALSTGDAVCVICFSDGYVADDWFSLCAATLERDPEVSLVWGMVVSVVEGNETDRHLPMIYAPFYEKAPEGWQLIGREIIKRVRHPSLILRLFKKNRREWKTKLGLASEVLKKKELLQKQDWFWYWLKTGTIFPDSNTCIMRKVMQTCVVPYIPGSYDQGDWGTFYFNFNSRGYLSYCIPKIASFGLDHRGRLSDRVTDYIHTEQKTYFENIATLRKRLQEHSNEMVFRDRDGNHIE